jgi:hypothetical protein
VHEFGVHGGRNEGGNQMERREADARDHRRYDVASVVESTMNVVEM